MRAGRRFAALCVLLASLLAAWAFPPASADYDSLKVVVVVEDKEFTDKDVANFTVHVYDKGVHVDPDATPNVTVEGTTRHYNYPLVRLATGLYNGTIDIAAIGKDFMGHVGIMAKATSGKSGPNDTVYNEDESGAAIIFRTNSTSGLRVSAFINSISDEVVRPGTRIAFGARVTWKAVPVDPESLECSVDLVDSPYWGSVPHTYIQMVRISTGYYECNYTIPELDCQSTIMFDAKAGYGGQSRSDSYWLVIDLYSVIYHRLSQTEADISFELLVGDPLGRPVSGAKVLVGYEFDNVWPVTYPTQSGETNSSGAVAMNIKYPPGTHEIEVAGEVNVSGRTQNFNIEIEIATSYRHKGDFSDKLQVDVTGGWEAPPPGQVMFRDCYAYYNASVWANETIYCYVRTGFFDSYSHSQQITKAEGYASVTDENGKFAVPVAVPGWTYWQLDFDFMSAAGLHSEPGENGSDHISLDGLNYSKCGTAMGFEPPWPARCEELEMKRGAIRTGSPVEVWCNRSEWDPPVGHVTWDINDSMNGSEWQVLEPISHYMSSNGSRLAGSALLPSFLPGGLNYSIYGLVKDHLQGWELDIAAASSSGGPVTPPVPPPRKDPDRTSTIVDSFCLPAGTMMVLVALGAALLVWYQGRKTQPPSEPPAGPGGQ